MSESSSSVPDEIADAEVEEAVVDGEDVERVELDVDQEKMEAWDKIKGDYQVDPAADGASGDLDDDHAEGTDGGEGEDAEG